jgi:hypothetical protein
MKESGRLPRTLLIVGFVAMLLGIVDPLEGSIVIFAGSALLLVGALLGRSRHRKLIAWAFALVAVGVGAMWGMSSIGGFGGSTGRSMWWALLLLPYPVGWVMGLAGGFRAMREGNGAPAPA